MATQPDPYRTLGLAPGASADDIHRAYRRLAKANHPDSAGEKALPRFLAIQAAYESLVGVQGSRRTGSRPPTMRPTPREAWRADADRARATRDGRGGPDGASSGRRRRPASEEPRRPASGRKRPPNKATLGSTSYDAAEDEPFEPEWSGGTWYGSSSGTYWTINPKEYADPRKHGPEYQRRARRGAGGEAVTGVAGAGAAGPGAGGDGAGGPDVDPAASDAAADPQSPPMTGAWQHWPDESASAASGRARSSPASSPSGDTAWDDVAGTTSDADAADRLAGAFSGAMNAATSGRFGGRAGLPARVAIALVGWPPIGVAISTVAGEVTGCGRFAAGCVEPFGVGTWLAQLAVLAILFALPSLAALSAVGTLAALAASVPTAVILSASGGSREPAASAAVLGGVLAVAYVAGVLFAIVRRRRDRRVP